MGSLGFQELFVIAIIIGLPILFYKLGQRSGYRKGKLDVYEEERRKQGI